MILMDTGQMVAILSASDRHHEKCLSAFRTLREPVATAWPVVTEAMYLLASSWSAQRALWELIESARLRVAAINEDDAGRMRELMQKYRDLPMDFADAALVRVAERDA